MDLCVFLCFCVQNQWGQFAPDKTNTVIRFGQKEVSVSLPLSLSHTFSFIFSTCCASELFCVYTHIHSKSCLPNLCSLLQARKSIHGRVGKQPEVHHCDEWWVQFKYYLSFCCSSFSSEVLQHFIYIFINIYNVCKSNPNAVLWFNLNISLNPGLRQDKTWQTLRVILKKTKKKTTNISVQVDCWLFPQNDALSNYTCSFAHLIKQIKQSFDEGFLMYLECFSRISQEKNGCGGNHNAIFQYKLEHLQE